MNSRLIAVSQQLSHITKIDSVTVDFGSVKQVMQLLYNTGVVPINKHPTASYNTYNWHSQLNNYSNFQTNG